MSVSLTFDVDAETGWLGLGDEMLAAPSGFFDTWMGEFEVALSERRHVTYTMHPEVIGRGYRMALLEPPDRRDARPRTRMVRVAWAGGAVLDR